MLNWLSVHVRKVLCSCITNTIGQYVFNTFKVNVLPPFSSKFQLAGVRSLSARAPWEAIGGRILEELWSNEWQRQPLYPETAREHLHGQSGPANETRWARTVPQPLQPQSVSTLVMKRPLEAKLCKKTNKHQFRFGQKGSLDTGAWQEVF